MSYFKYILKGFKTNISRLLAIIAIITLGIGFLVGLSTSSTDIRTSVNTMYSETNVMDLNLKSTIGFSKSTVNMLDDRSDMDAEGAFLFEAKESFLNTSKIKSRLISTDIKNAKINKLTLVDGRMPEGKNECVVLKDMEVYHKASIGDKIIVKDEKMDINETYTVVGIVSSPLYFAKDKEYNLTGTNRLDLLFFVDSTLNDFDLITDIYIRTTVKDDRFASSYFDKVNDIADEIKAMDEEILDTRIVDIKADIKQEIIDTKLDEIKNTVDKEIRKEIRENILKEENYEDFKLEVRKEVKNKIKEELLKEKNYNELKENIDKYAGVIISDDMKNDPDLKAKVDAEVEKVKADTEALARIDVAVKDAIIPELRKQFITDPNYASFYTMAVNGGVTNHKNAIKAELTEKNGVAPTDEEIQKEYDSRSEEEKQRYKDENIDTFVNLAYGLADPNAATPMEMLKPLIKQKVETKDSFIIYAGANNYFKSLTDEEKKNDYYDPKVNELTDDEYKNLTEEDFNKAYSEALETAVNNFEGVTPEKRNDAYNTAIDEAVEIAYNEFINNDKNEDESKLTSFSELESQSDKKFEELFVLNLKANQSYISVKENSNKIDKIAVIFPVFFYFIAALVALTTITRLVDEERGIIGLFKSLGFSKFKILSKYLLFALVCSVVGSALGNLAGVYALPYVVYGAYKTILDLPPMVYTVEAMINGISVAMMILTIMGVATYVTLSSLKERPAQLLQPKAPRPGKRLLLERWKGLWKRIKFKYKNTIRNIFRYKKNLAMMMVGVGGCVALLLTAFGIRDAFDTLASVQYDKIITYDLRVNVDDGTSLPTNIMDSTTKAMFVNNKLVYLDGDDDYQISRIITNAPMNDFFTFKHDGKDVEFSDGDVVLDFQLAKKFDLKVGSKFKFDDSDKEYTLTGIFDNHIDNYAFIYDSELMDSECNTYFMNLVDGTNEDKLLDDLEISNVLGVESISQRKRSFDTMLSSVVLILVVVIICSGALAIIVIYNLTNININERLKEIATLKVLGYQNKEVYGYIYREIFVLTIFGILLGFLVGPFLYKFVMLNLNEPGLMFPTSVHPLNYLYSFLLTLLFAFIVDLILIRKIKNIKMVESLKCVD